MPRISDDALTAVARLLGIADAWVPDSPIFGGDSREHIEKTAALLQKEGLLERHQYGKVTYWTTKG